MRHHVENRHTVSIIKNAAFTTFLQKKLPLLRNIAALLIGKRLHSVYTHTDTNTLNRKQKHRFELHC